MKWLTNRDLGHFLAKPMVFVEGVDYEGEIQQAPFILMGKLAVDLDALINQHLNAIKDNNGVARLPKTCAGFHIDDLWEMVEQMLEFVHQSSKLGFAHLDIKPKNVCWDVNARRAKFIDLGISHLPKDGNVEDLHMERHQSEWLGTETQKPPEVWPSVARWFTEKVGHTFTYYSSDGW